MANSKPPSYLNFEHEGYSWKPDINYQKFPHKYHVGKGEQGVLICEPYKSAILPHWRFKTPEIAQASSEKILEIFLDYLKNHDFVGADMARKFLQMGFTRARRYANYRGGKKYNANADYKLLPRGTGSEEKAESAAIFYKAWKTAEANPEYSQQKIAWKKQYG